MKTLLTLLALTTALVLTSCNSNKVGTDYYDLTVIEGILEGAIINNVILSDTMNIGDTVKFDGDKAVINNKVECNLCK